MSLKTEYTEQTEANVTEQTEDDEKSKQTDADGIKQTKSTNDAVIEWKDFNPDLEIVKTEQKNKSDQIEMKRDEHSDQHKIDETKKVFKYIDSKILTNSGNTIKDLHSWTMKAVEHVGVYGSKLALEATVGAVSLISVAALSYGGHCAYTYFRNWQEDNKLDKKKNHNIKVELFNSKLQQLQILQQQLLRKKMALIEQEKKLSNFTFLVERGCHNDSKVIVCIGPTGYGKSLVCNRLIGNKKCVEELEDSENEPFDVAICGEIESQTKDLSKKIKQVNLIKNDKKTTFVLSVVDSPGAFDSDGQDEQFQNQMAEYFRASGGVNMFCIFFKFEGKYDQNYKKLLEIYETFWGKEFWKHAVIVITKCDRDSKKSERRLEKALPRTKAKIKKFLLEEMNVLNEIPIYEFGEDNFELSIREMFSSLIKPEKVNLNQKVYHEKYKCDNIKSPIDELWKEIKPIYDDYVLLIKQLNDLHKKAEQSKAEIQ